MCVWCGTVLVRSLTPCSPPHSQIVVLAIDANCGVFHHIFHFLANNRKALHKEVMVLSTPYSCIRVVSYDNVGW